MRDGRKIAHVLPGADRSPPLERLRWRALQPEQGSRGDCGALSARNRWVGASRGISQISRGGRGGGEQAGCSRNKVLAGSAGTRGAQCAGSMGRCGTKHLTNFTRGRRGAEKCNSLVGNCSPRATVARSTWFGCCSSVNPSGWSAWGARGPRQVSSPGTSTDLTCERTSPRPRGPRENLVPAGAFRGLGAQRQLARPPRRPSLAQALLRAPRASA